MPFVTAAGRAAEDGKVKAVAVVAVAAAAVFVVVVEAVAELEDTNIRDAIAFLASSSVALEACVSCVLLRALRSRLYCYSKFFIIRCSRSVP